MDEKTEKQSQEKTAKQDKDMNEGLDRLPSGIEEVKKLHGARKSKVDPAQMTILQHEEAKLRIFKRIMILLGIMVVLFVAYAIYAHILSKDEEEQYIHRTKEKLAALEATFSKESPEKIYTSAVNAAEAARRAGDLADFAIRINEPELHAEMTEKIKEYEKVMLESSPVDHRPFVASTVMLDMVPIKAGAFLMGDNRELAIQSETPCVNVTITKPFWISKYEITNRQVRRLIPSHFVKKWDHYDLNANDLPAGDISWNEAVLYCKTLTDKERRLGRVPVGYEYRLPTEAEWEYVCRAGSTTNYHWGDEFGAEGAKYANSLDLKAGKAFEWMNVDQPDVAPEDPFHTAAPVGSFQPNAWGIYDMSGNVAEWCYDYFAPNTYIILNNAPHRNDPCNMRPVDVKYERLMNFDAQVVTLEIPCRVIRGGNWGCSPDTLRSSCRKLKMPQNEKNNSVGFRPVLAPIIKNNNGNTVR